MRNSKQKRYSKRACFLSVSEQHDNNCGALHAEAYETCQAELDKNAQKAFTVIPNFSYLVCYIWNLSILQDL